MRHFVTAAALAALPFFAASARAVGPASRPTTAPTVAEVRAEGIRLLSAGRQSDAEEFVFAQARAHPTRETVFFAAVLIRSRFDLDRADPLFDRIAKVSPASVEGQVAERVVAIDANRDAEANFAALDQLHAAHPDDPLLLWLVGIECRQLDKKKPGIERYQQLLKMLDPGPVLVHQTLGNLLLDDGQAAAALQQYDIAIALEPAAWDYNCRANALVKLDRPADAAAAYQKAVDLDPDYALAWRNWARLNATQGDFKGAAEKVAKADAIERRP